MNFLPSNIHHKNPIQLIELPPSPSGEPLDEAVLAVHDIVKTCPAPYTLMLSGGVDSQAMLYAWVKAGVKFKAVSVRYGDMNSHDVETLERFIENSQLKTKVKYVDFEIVDFLENELVTYASKYRCSSPQICTHMKMSEKITDGTVIFSGNYVMSEARSGPSLTYAILGLHRYAVESGRSVIPFFFLHTPSLAYSFIKYEDASTVDRYISKVKTYQSAGFPVLEQPAKYTGFERVKEMYDKRKDLVDLKTRLRFAGKPSNRIFDLVFRYPYEQQINDPRIDYIYSFLKQDNA